MSSLINTWRFQLGGMLVIAAAVAAAFWIGEGAQAGLLAGAWMLAFVALVHFGRNKVDALNVIGGVGDERTRSLYTSAIAFAGNVTAFVIVGWWLATVVDGDPNQTLSLLGAVLGVSFVGAAIFLSRRS
jgi:uncharacterized membrane protein YccF (DUF307 family)